MQIYFYVLGSGILVMMVSLIGVIFIQKNLRGWFSKNIGFLVSLSAGVFLFTAFNLITESLGIAKEIGQKNLSIVSILFGFIVFLLSQKFFPESHHHHEDDCGHGHKKSTVNRMLFGDSVHNVADGVFIVTSFMIDIRIGIITTLSVLIHESLQEISEFFVLKNLGLTTKQALLRNLAVSSTVFIGIAVGFLSGKLEIFSTIILGFTGGAFIYIVFHDLIPYKTFKQKAFWKHFLFFLFGFLIVFLINSIGGHS